MSENLSHIEGGRSQSTLERASVEDVQAWESEAAEEVAKVPSEPQFRAWATDPVTELSTVVDLPELVRSERFHTNGHTSNHAAVLDPPVTILGVPFSSVTVNETISRIDEMIASRRPHFIVTANVDFLVQAREDIELHRILLEADLVLCDGQPLVWISRLLGKPLPERVAGSDLVPELIRVAAAKGHRIFLLGGTPDVAARAVVNIQSTYPGVKICGFYSPEFNPLLKMEHDEIVKRIREAKPDLLFVSLGCPKAEKWMFMHYRSLGVPVAIGVGATIDFLAKRMKRAPHWMRRSGTEWLFRLCQEPRRLVRRYSKDARRFGGQIVRQLWSLERHRRPPKHCSPAIACLIEPTSRRLRPPEELCRKTIARDSGFWNDALGQHCLLELGHVRFVDSAGVGLLIALRRKLLGEGRVLVLLEPSDAVRRALKLMCLEHYFLIADDVLQARELINACLHRARITALSAHATLPLIWQGEITATNADEFWTIAQTQIDSFEEYAEPITIDLSGVSFIDSTGAGLLLRVQRYAAEKGAVVRYIDPQPDVRNVLRISGAESVLLDRNGHSHKLGKFSRFRGATLQSLVGRRA